MEHIEAWLPLLRSPGGDHSLRLQRQHLVDDAGGRYPVEHGIPRLLDPEALQGVQARWKRFFDWLAPLYDLSERVGVRLLCGFDLRTEQRECARVLRPGGLLFLGDEGFIPTMPAQAGLRRLLLLHMNPNPSFRRPPPQVPPQLTLKKQEHAYDGLAFLWTLERAEA